MRILRDPSLSSYHLKVVGSLMFIFKVLCNMAVVHFLNLLLLLFLFPDFYSFFFSRLVNGTRLRAILTKGQPWFICRSGSYSQTA